MIQDIFPHKLDNHYYPARKADASSIVIAFKDQDVIVKGDLFPRVEDLPDVNSEDLIYLFSLDDENNYF